MSYPFEEWDTILEYAYMHDPPLVVLAEYVQHANLWRISVEGTRECVAEATSGTAQMAVRKLAQQLKGG